MFWQNVAEWIKGKPLYDEFLKHLVSIHYMPADPFIVTMAQILHWQGFGGDGQVLKPFFSKRCPMLNLHYIGYISVDATQANFTKLIANIVAHMQDYVSTQIESYCTHRYPRPTSAILFADIGSGPQAKMIKPSLLALQERGYKVHLDTFDICSFHFDPDIPKQMHYLDANRFFKGTKPNQYDVVCAGYVLHQLVDIVYVLKQLLCMTKSGAYSHLT